MPTHASYYLEQPDNNKLRYFRVLLRTAGGADRPAVAITWRLPLF
jgi:hypothetical protein